MQIRERYLLIGKVGMGGWEDGGMGVKKRGIFFHNRLYQFKNQSCFEIINICLACAFLDENTKRRFCF